MDATKLIIYINLFMGGLCANKGSAEEGGNAGEDLTCNASKRVSKQHLESRIVPSSEPKVVLVDNNAVPFWISWGIVCLSIMSCIRWDKLAPSEEEENSFFQDTKFGRFLKGFGFDLGC